MAFSSWLISLLSSSKRSLALPADKLGQLEMVRILLGPIAFPDLLGYPAFALMHQQLELFFDGPQRAAWPEVFVPGKSGQ